MTCSGTQWEDCSVCPNHFVHDYFAANEEIVIKSSTAETYRGILRRFDDFLSERDLSIIDAEQEDVVNYIETCVRNGNRRSTLNVKLGAISNLYRHIRLRMDAGEELAVDPIELDTINLQKYNTPEPVEREALSREELRKLFDSMNSYRNRLLVITGAETGLRNSDLREIKISDVDFDELKIRARNPKNSRPYDVPISEQLAFETRQWIRHHRGAYDPTSDSDYLFPSKSGPKLTTNTSLNSIVKEAAEGAGIQEVIGTSEIGDEQAEALGIDKEARKLHRVTVHALRHTFLTLLKDSDVPLAYRQLVANHSDPSTTMEYTHGSNDVFETIRDRFDPPR
jgi:integrase/recombinase XerD